MNNAGGHPPAEQKHFRPRDDAAPDASSSKESESEVISCQTFQQSEGVVGLEEYHVLHVYFVNVTTTVIML